jgi:hypothetical protein
VILRREVTTAAAAAAGDQDFFARLQRAGIRVRMRYSTRDPGEVTGYAVALDQDTASTGEPVWYGGGKLAADLTLPKLRQRWSSGPGDGRAVPGGRLTPGERAAIWDHASRAATDAAAQIRSLAAAGEPGAAADAAWAAGDTLHAAAAALGSRVIRQAASAYDRAARSPYGRIPQPTSAGIGLRRASRLLSAAAFASHDRTLAQIALIARLAALADAVAELRDAQRHAAQAAAARLAAERLHAVADGTTGRLAQERAQSPVMTGLAQEAFPALRRQRQPNRAAPGRRPSHRPSSQPQRGSPPRRPRGRRW